MLFCTVFTQFDTVLSTVSRMWEDESVLAEDLAKPCMPGETHPQDRLRFAFKLMNTVVETMNFVFKMMNSAFHVMISHTNVQAATTFDPQ